MNGVNDERRRPETEWVRAMFGAKGTPAESVSEAHATDAARIRAQGLEAPWVQRLFDRTPAAIPARGDRMAVVRDGLPVCDFALSEFEPETVIGRHPRAGIQLEAQQLAMFHACLWKLDDEYYIESLEDKYDTLLNRRRLKPRYPVQLRDGAVVDLAGFQLLFTLPQWPPAGDADSGPGNHADIPDSPETPAVTAPPGPAVSPSVEAWAHRGLWSEGHTTLRVVDLIEEAEGARTLRFAGEPPRLFSYRPGQFATLSLNIDGREVQRSYSISSSPSRPHLLEFTVKRVAGGLVSNWLCERLKPGDIVRVRGPSGSFTCSDENSARKLLFLAAGSGMAPIMSMCRWIVDTAADVDVKVLASFRSPADILFRQELEWLAARHRAFQVALTLTGGRRGPAAWTGFVGRVCAPMIQLLAPDYRQRDVYLCGPDPFMASVKGMLHAMGFDLARLHSESFQGGRVSGTASAPAGAPILSGPRHQVTFLKSGMTVETDENLSLLALAEAHGIEIDYSCRSGSCGECEIKCRGDVAFTPGCEIDDQQRAAGFVYACSCVAKSDLSVEA